MDLNLESLTNESLVVPTTTVTNNDSTDDVSTPIFSLKNKISLDDVIDQFHNQEVDESIFIGKLAQVYRYVEKGKNSIAVYIKTKYDSVLRTEEYYYEFDMNGPFICSMEKYHILKTETIFNRNGTSSPEQIKLSWKTLIKNNLKAFKVKSIDFCPFSEREEHVVDQNVMNLFSGWKAKWVNHDRSKFEKIDEHIKKYYCSNNEEYYDYFMKWLAHMFQHPDQKVPTAIILKSEQGGGKNIIFDWLNNFVIGNGLGTTISNIDKISAKFNSTLVNKMFMVINEAVAGENKRADSKAYEVMKSLITDMTQHLEYKGKDPIEFKSFCRYMFGTNKIRPVVIEEGCRRYFVLEFKKPEEDYENYMRTLRSTLNQESADHFYSYLMSIDLMGWDATTKLPMTEAKKDIIELSLPKEVLFIKQHKWIGRMKNQTLYKYYTNWCKDNGYNNKISSYIWFSKNISKYVNTVGDGRGYKERLFLPQENQDEMTLLEADQAQAQGPTGPVNQE